MDKYWFTIMLYILKYWSWPITVLILATIFRKSIFNILSQVTEVKLGNASLKIYKAKETANQLFGKDLDNKSNKDLSNVTGTIVDNWKAIEQEINNIAVRNGFISSNHVITQNEIHFLESEGLLSGKQVKLLDNLRRIRNRAVHVSEKQLNITDAQNYSDATNTVILSLQSNYAGSKSRVYGKLINSTFHRNSKTALYKTSKDESLNYVEIAVYPKIKELDVSTLISLITHYSKTQKIGKIT